jgi:hypothetical protein
MIRTSKSLVLGVVLTSTLRSSTVAAAPQSPTGTNMTTAKAVNSNVRVALLACGEDSGRLPLSHVTVRSANKPLRRGQEAGEF